MPSNSLLPRTAFTIASSGRSSWLYAITGLSSFCLDYLVVKMLFPEFTTLVLAQIWARATSSIYNILMLIYVVFKIHHNKLKFLKGYAWLYVVNLTIITSLLPPIYHSKFITSLGGGYLIFSKLFAEILLFCCNFFVLNSVARGIKSNRR